MQDILKRFFCVNRLPSILPCACLSGAIELSIANRWCQFTPRDQGWLKISFVDVYDVFSSGCSYSTNESCKDQKMSKFRTSKENQLPCIISHREAHYKQMPEKQWWGCGYRACAEETKEQNGNQNGPSIEEIRVLSLSIYLIRSTRLVCEQERK